LNEALEELKYRRAIARFAIKTIQSMMDDPRAANALERYSAQLSEIDMRITEIEEELHGKPEPVVVSIKSTSLAGKVSN